MSQRKNQKRAEILDLMKTGANALVIAISGDALKMLKILFPFLRPGMPFVIYSEYTQVSLLIFTYSKKGKYFFIINEIDYYIKIFIICFLKRSYSH